MKKHGTFKEIGEKVLFPLQLPPTEERHSSRYVNSIGGYSIMEKMAKSSVFC